MLGAVPFLLLAVLGARSQDAVGVHHVYRLPSGVEVTIVEAPFKKAQFRVSGCLREGEPCRIDGRAPFGRVAALPKTYIARISISFAGAMYTLESSGMYDAWGDRPLEYPGKVRYLGGRCFDAKNCQIRGLFSDGAGTFVAEWKVVDGEPTRTVLTDSNDVVDLFMKNIDPPTCE